MKLVLQEDEKLGFYIMLYIAAFFATLFSGYYFMFMMVVHAGLAYLAKIVYNPAYKGFISKHWPATKATQFSADIIEKSAAGSSSSSYKLVVNYTYTVANIQYEGSTYRLPFGIHRSVDTLHETLNELNSHQSISVHYNPLNPTISTLKTGVSSLDSLALFIFTVAVSVIILGLWLPVL